MVRLTRTVVLRGISRVSVDKKDVLMIDEQFGKVTSLHLQAKNIDILDSLKLFTSLTNLYLYENQIRVIEGLEQARNLENLHLQRNNLQRLENLEKCTNLRKLYLGYNEIQVIEGLEEAKKLRELHVEYQRLPPGLPLIFSPITMETLASSLIVLNIAGNHMKTIEDLTGMDRLDTLYAEKNNLENLDDTILITSTLRRLRILNLKDNPICKDRKYKEKIIGYSENIEVLDGKDITNVTRDFIKRFCSVKAARLEHAVKKYGRMAAEQLAAKNAVVEDTYPYTYNNQEASSRAMDGVDSYNQWQQSQMTTTAQQTPYANEFTFSTPTVASPRNVGTVYPTQEEWSRLMESGKIPPEALARYMVPENIPVPAFVLHQSGKATYKSSEADEYDTENETSDTATTREVDYDENIKTWYEDTQGLSTSTLPDVPNIAPISMTPKSPEEFLETEDTEEKKMSDMAKVIFRLSNLSTSTNKSNAKYNHLTPVWMKPGTSLPATRSLSPMEHPLEVTTSARLSSSYASQSSKASENKGKKSQSVRSAVRKAVPIHSPTPVPETELDDNPPFVTTVLELPPWPHITRRMGTGNRKITFMP